MAVTGLIMPVHQACAHACTHVHLYRGQTACAPPACTPPPSLGSLRVAEEPPSSGASPTRLRPGGVCASGSGSGRVTGASRAEGLLAVTPGQAHGWSGSRACSARRLRKPHHTSLPSWLSDSGGQYLRAPEPLRDALYPGASLGLAAARADPGSLPLSREGASSPRSEEPRAPGRPRCRSASPWLRATPSLCSVERHR